MVILLIIVLYFFAYGVYSFIITKKNRKRLGISQKIKTSYKKIEVQSNKIDILTNDYYEDVENGVMSVQSIDALYKNRNLQTIHKYISVLSYNFIQSGKKYIFKSIPINFSRMQLEQFLRNRPNITIYYDELDLSKHYFDLSEIIEN